VIFFSPPEDEEGENPSMKRQSLLPSLLLFCLVIQGQAQQQSPPPPQQTKPAPQQSEPNVADQDVIRINTNLVQVDAVVTKDGKQVTDLKPEDFQIFEDGHPQVITNFSYISNVAANSPPIPPAPRESKNKAGVPVIPPAIRPHDARRIIAFVVDDLGMAFDTIGHAKSQLRKFVNEQLQPNDLVAIVRTGSEVGALQQFTTDKRLLQSAIDHLKWNPCSRAGFSIFRPAERACSEQSYGATISALRFVVRGMSDLPGRKSMVVLSDSMPIDQQENETVTTPRSVFAPQPTADADLRGLTNNDSLDLSNNFQQAIQSIAELAIRGSVVIYAIDTRGVIDTFPSADERPTGTARGPNSTTRQLQRTLSSRSAIVFSNREGSGLIARQTGGLLLSNSNDLGLKRVLEDQRGYYLIGYRPNGETFNRNFHKITIQVKQHGLSVRTRAGFYGITDDQARPPQSVTRDALSTALMSPFGSNDLTVHFTTFFTNTTETGSLLRSFLYINAHDLAFTDEADGSHKAAFDLISVVFGDNGRAIYEKSQTATLQLKAEEYARILREGFVYNFDVPVKQPGALQFRVAVRDKTSLHIGTAGQFIEVPDLNKHQLTLSGIVLSSDPTERQKVSPTPPSPTNNSVNGGQSTGIDETKIVDPAVRRFRQGTNLIFAYAIYNAHLDKTTHLPQLTSQTRIFRDGQLIYNGALLPLNASGQSDLQRITGGSRLQLGSDFPAGEYVLQVIVTDNLASEKQRTLAQWIDFEVTR
jgi:VWFA-related protein